MMHFQRLLLLLFLVLFYTVALAQTTISGVVTDQKTGETLPYVTVFLKSENMYSRADENGAFKIYPSKRIPNDTLVFTSISYLSAKVVIGQITNNLKVTLQQDVTLLREVKISGREMILGAYTKSGHEPQKGTTMITRRFMKEDGYNYLKRVVIWRKPDRLSGKGKAMFRITIFNSEDGYRPPNGVVYEQILVEDTDKAEIVVDLIKYHILLPTNYFFVGVERIKGPKKQQLEPLIYTTKDRQYSWVKLFGENGWQNIYVKPAISATVM